MKEIDVALTDYGLAFECSVFAFVLIRNKCEDQPLSIWFAFLFASVGLASIMGGTIHGFVHEDTLSEAIFWRATIVSIGISALTAWVIGAKILLGNLGQRVVFFVAALNFSIYLGYVVFFNQNFVVAVANYLPAAIFLLVVFAILYNRNQQRLVFLALAGVILTFVAAAIQQIGIGVHAEYFNHNALYHVVQAVGLYLIFRGSMFVVELREKNGMI
ncbi:MAG: hypothetical protein CL896_02615 [Dehalococcoidia bacterium]|nr:hypothetical protein [Dehalococcoidia bacterium]|tara:strand:+ start:27660 stop:28307 length:648 start_codon:yes stop_codon:yes gene_type:complete